MKKRKRHIISVIIILLVMVLVFLGNQIVKEKNRENVPIDIWFIEMID